MEAILKYVSLITMSGAAISFIISFYKWIDQRNREEEQRQSEAFHKMVCLATGNDETGKKITLTQQLAAIYQLQRYQKYSFASIPVLEHMISEYKAMNDKRSEPLVKALENTINALSEH